MAKTMRSIIEGGITDRRSAAGRAPDALSNHKDRDARPVRCNGWLSRTSEPPSDGVDHGAKGLSDVIII
jgi:hypothetical protein